MRVGFNFIRENSVILALMGMDTCVNFFGAYRSMMLVFARDILGTGPTGLGACWPGARPGTGFRAPGAGCWACGLGAGLAGVGSSSKALLSSEFESIWSIEGNADSGISKTMPQNGHRLFRSVVLRTWKPFLQDGHSNMIIRQIPEKRHVFQRTRASTPAKPDQAQVPCLTRVS